MKMKWFKIIISVFLIVLLIQDIKSEMSSEDLKEAPCHFRFATQICDCNYSDKVYNIYYIF
jgi:hypothetical protein